MTIRTDSAQRYLATVPDFVLNAIPAAKEAQAAYAAAVEVSAEHARQTTAALIRLAEVSYVGADGVHSDLVGTPKPGFKVEDVAAASAEVRRLRGLDHKVNEARDDALLALAEVVSADPARNRAIAQDKLAAAERALEKVAQHIETKGTAQAFLASMDAAADRSNMLAPRAPIETAQARARRRAREAAGVEKVVIAKAEVAA